MRYAWGGWVTLIVTLRRARDVSRILRDSIVRVATRRIRRCHRRTEASGGRQAPAREISSISSPSVLLAAKVARSARGVKTVTIMLIAGAPGWKVRVKSIFPARTRRRGRPRAARHTIISRHLLNKQTDGRLFLVYFRPAVCAKILRSAWLSREKSRQASPISTRCAHKIVRGAQQVCHCSETCETHHVVVRARIRHVPFFAGSLGSAKAVSVRVEV